MTTQNKNKVIIAVRCIISFLLPHIYIFICYGTELGLLLLLPTVFIISLVYIIPFLINGAKIKAASVPTIVSFVISDLLFSIIPSVAGCFFTSLVLYIFFEGFKDIWFFSTIIIVVYTVLTLYFWLKYYVANSISKHREQHGE